jgi:hypothetical protein
VTYIKEQTRLHVRTARPRRRDFRTKHRRGSNPERSSSYIITLGIDNGEMNRAQM